MSSDDSTNYENLSQEIPVFGQNILQLAVSINYDITITRNISNLVFLNYCIKILKKSRFTAIVENLLQTILFKII